MDTVMQRREQRFANPRSWTNRSRDGFVDVDNSRLRTDCEHSASDAAACPRTVEAAACALIWIVRAHDCLCGLNADTDCSRTWRIRVCDLFAAESSPWTGRCHVHELPIARGDSACPPRLIRGHQVLRWRRGKACPVLSMTRNALPALLAQLIAPMLQLRGNDLDAAGLLDGR